MKTFKKIFACIVALFGTFAVGTSTWIINSTEATGKTEVKKDTVTKAACYNSTTNRKFLSVSLACELAKSGETIFMCAGDKTTNTFTETNNIVVKSGTTLVLPFAGEYWSEEYKEGVSNLTPDTNSSNVSTHRKIELCMRNGADITVEVGGTLIIGGITNTVGTSGYYSEINLGDNSSITCNGSMTCFGYIKEEAATAKNGSGTDDLLNENDQNRFVRFNGTSFLTVPLAIHNSRGGGAMTALNDAGVCPLNEFNFSNIQTYSIYEYGCKMEAKVRVDAAGKYLEVPAGVISTIESKTNTKSIFYLSSGSLRLEYIPKNPLYTAKGPTSDYSRVIVDGQAEIGSLYADAKITQAGITAGVTIDTTKYFLPFSYMLHTHIANGANLTVPYKLKFMPGTEVKIHKGGNLNINNEVIFYTNKSILELSNNDGFSYPKDLKDAKLINNGTLTVSGNGKLGAFIEHTSQDGTATINLLHTSNANLTVTSLEGTTHKQIIIQSEVLSLNKNTNTVERFVFSAGTNMTSIYANNQYYWDGKLVITNILKVKLANITLTHPIFNYSIRMSTGANGTGTVTNLATDKQVVGEYKIETGCYVNITLKRTKSAKFTAPSNITFDQNKWYLVEGTFELEITPNEGIKVYINTVGNSGAGHVQYTLYESTSTNAKKGTWNFVSETLTGTLTCYVIKGLNFKFESKSQFGFWYTSKDIIKKPPECTHTSHGKAPNYGAVLDKNKLGNYNVYPATGDYEFKFMWESPIKPPKPPAQRTAEK